MMDLRPADVIITCDKDSLLSKVILSVLRVFQSDPVEYQHTMLVVDGIRCIEALNKITYSYLEHRFQDFKRYKIIRHRNITDEEREAIVKRAQSMYGESYGYARLGLQLLDQAFNTNWFTRRIKNPRYQICSSLVAWCYDVETGIRFNHINWSAVEPDDVDDESLRYDTDFETILEWEMK